MLIVFTHTVYASYWKSSTYCVSIIHLSNLSIIIVIVSTVILLNKSTNNYLDLLDLNSYFIFSSALY